MKSVVVCFFIAVAGCPGLHVSHTNSRKTPSLQWNTKPYISNFTGKESVHIIAPSTLLTSFTVQTWRSTRVMITSHALISEGIHSSLRGLILYMPYYKKTMSVSGYPPKPKMLHVSIIMIYIGVEESVCQINLIKCISQQDALLPGYRL